MHLGVRALSRINNLLSTLVKNCVVIRLHPDPYDFMSSSHET